MERLGRFTPTCVGTTVGIAWATTIYNGSPPRAWGQRPLPVLRLASPRFTPTCVGTTVGIAWATTIYNGSPPRAWGQRAPGPVSRILSRFTPTCVGTTRNRVSCYTSITVHPHVRGDNMPIVAVVVGFYGSPPRAWGQRFVGAPSSAPFPVHPHVRGDNGRFRNWPPRRSVHPHVRGDNGFADYAVSTVKRFTPTCVGTTRRVWGLRGVIAVHPHVRGANVRPLRVGIHNQRFTPTCVGTTSALFARKGDGTGSPPRAWGQRPPSSPYIRYSRFTPTCVGTTISARVRMRAAAGSPPRAWGQRAPGPVSRILSRFTPTCVGTTAKPILLPAPQPVHPHVRGDNDQVEGELRRQAGSPPRAWGQLAGKFRHHQNPRFTPTCVGTTGTTSRPCCPRTVHPHVRGDNESPSSHIGVVSRFTPTCVGTTPPPQRGMKSLAVHPHVRGDNVTGHECPASNDGSPPRAWGQLSISPASIGTSTVHPHVRGDNTVCAADRHVFAGSPPRAWGQHHGAAMDCTRDRFTPTCVGTTFDNRYDAPTEPVHPHVRGDNRNSRSPPGAFHRFLALGGSSRCTRISPSSSTICREVLPKLRTANPCSVLAL